VTSVLLRNLKNVTKLMSQDCYILPPSSKQKFWLRQWFYRNLINYHHYISLQ